MRRDVKIVTSRLIDTVEIIITFRYMGGLKKNEANPFILALRKSKMILRTKNVL